MAYLFDWNFEILPPLFGDCTDVQISLSSMQSAFDRFGVRKFLLLAHYDPNISPLSLHLLMRNAYGKALQNSLPRPLILQTASRTTLREGFSGMEGIERLCHKKSGYLPLNLPISVYEDWMDAELNRLLYRRHQKLLFLSFEMALILYPPKVLEKLMRIESAAFQFGYHSLGNSAVQNAIKVLLHKEKPVLLGTGWDRPEKCLNEDLFSYLEAAKPAFSKVEWDTLFHINRHFGVE